MRALQQDSWTQSPRWLSKLNQYSGSFLAPLLGAFCGFTPARADLISRMRRVGEWLPFRAGSKIEQKVMHPLRVQIFLQNALAIFFVLVAHY